MLFNFCFLPRQPDENRRKHGEYICLDECHEYLEAIHEYSEDYGHGTEA